MLFFFFGLHYSLTPLFVFTSVEINQTSHFSPTCAMASLFCSRHKSYLPSKNFTIHADDIPTRCDACLEKDCVQREAERVARIAAITDAAHSLNTFKEICSELETQKELEPVTHSISFDSVKPFDFHLSDPGDDAMRNLDPVSETGKNLFKTHADMLAKKLWKHLECTWKLRSN